MRLAHRLPRTGCVFSDCNLASLSNGQRQQLGLDSLWPSICACCRALASDARCPRLSYNYPSIDALSAGRSASCLAGQTRAGFQSGHVAASGEAAAIKSEINTSEEGELTSYSPGSRICTPRKRKDE